MQLEFPSDEEWLELDVDDQYLVSTHGRLYDLTQNALVYPKVITPSTGSPGWVWLIRESRPGLSSRVRKIWAGAAVLRHFVGNGRIVVYKDGNIRNLRIDNLMWRFPDPEIGGGVALAGSTVASG